MLLVIMTIATITLTHQRTITITTIIKLKRLTTYHYCPKKVTVNLLMVAHNYEPLKPQPITTAITIITTYRSCWFTRIRIKSLKRIILLLVVVVVTIIAIAIVIVMAKMMTTTSRWELSRAGQKINNNKGNNIFTKNNNHIKIKTTTTSTHAHPSSTPSHTN